MQLAQLEPSSGVAHAGSARAAATGGVRALWCSVLRLLLAVLRGTAECRLSGSVAAVLQVPHLSCSDPLRLGQHGRGRTVRHGNQTAGLTQSAGHCNGLAVHTAVLQLELQALTWTRYLQASDLAQLLRRAPAAAASAAVSPAAAANGAADVRRLLLEVASLTLYATTPGGGQAPGGRRGSIDANGEAAATDAAALPADADEQYVTAWVAAATSAARPESRSGPQRLGHPSLRALVLHAEPGSVGNELCLRGR